MAPGAVLTIEVVGVHAVSGALALDHPDGHRIELVGGSVTAGADVLEFTSSGGLWVARTRLRRLDNLTVRGVAITAEPGLLVSDGGALTVGPDVFVEDFHHGVRVLTTSAIDAADGITVTGSSGSCLSALHGSTLYAPYSDLDGCAVGVQVQNSSTAVVFDATVTDATGRGLLASGDASIDADGASVTAQGHCAYAIYGSTIQLQTGSCTVDTPTDDSTNRAAYAHHGSFVMAGSATLEAELGEAVAASQGATAIAWSGATMRTDAPYVVFAATNSVVRVNTAVLEGAYTGGADINGQSYVDWSSVTDPNSVTHDVEASSLIEL